MNNLKTFFGLIAGSAVIGIVYILDVSRKTNAKNKSTTIAQDYPKNLTDNFTGWLKRLQQDIDKEINDKQQLI